MRTSDKVLRGTQEQIAQVVLNSKWILVARRALGRHSYLQSGSMKPLHKVKIPEVGTLLWNSSKLGTYRKPR